VVHMQRGSVLHHSTKLEVDSLFHCKVIRGSQNLEIRSRDRNHERSLSGRFMVCMLERFMSVPNLNRLALHSKVIGGPKISKLGHVTLSHAPFEPETLSLCRNPYSHTYCQILCFYSLIRCCIMDKSNVNGPF